MLLPGVNDHGTIGRVGWHTLDDATAARFISPRGDDYAALGAMVESTPGFFGFSGEYGNGLLAERPGGGAACARAISSEIGKALRLRAILDNVRYGEAIDGKYSAIIDDPSDTRARGLLGICADETTDEATGQARRLLSALRDLGDDAPPIVGQAHSWDAGGADEYAYAVELGENEYSRYLRAVALRTRAGFVGGPRVFWRAELADNDGPALLWAELGAFPSGWQGAHDAAAEAWRAVCELHLSDMRATPAPDGGMTWRAESCISAIWSHMLNRLAIGRAEVCDACGRAFITNGERGQRSRTCSAACKMWLRRHAEGVKRPIR